MLRIPALTARCRTYSILLLLVSTAAHGLTPAQHSLASNWAWFRYFSIQDSTDYAGDANDPQEGDCESTEPERRRDLHLLAGCPEALTTWIPQKMELTSSWLRCPQGSLLSPYHLSIVLCRLAC